jgi:hypothetical protein
MRKIITHDPEKLQTFRTRSCAKSKKETAMPQPDIRRELRNAPVEPLLPIEKKLIGWSLGIGLVLLVLLVLVNHYAPVTSLP